MKIERSRQMKGKNKLLLVLFLSLSSQLLFAQAQPVATGAEGQGAGGTISYSIGQVDYINLENNTLKINQGLQQPIEIMVFPGDQPILIDLNPEFEIYPNPAREYTVLHVKKGESKNLSYMLYDMLGRVLARQPLVDVKTTIRMDQLPSAIYILTVIDDQTQKIITQFKIVKIL